MREGRYKGEQGVLGSRVKEGEVGEGEVLVGERG